MKPKSTEKKLKEVEQKKENKKKALELLEQLVQISVEHFFKNNRE
jgi:hypothetical protein